MQRQEALGGHRLPQVVADDDVPDARPGQDGSQAGRAAAGVEAGFKASGGADLALVVNNGPEHAVAAQFTSNRVAAAPVHWSREVARQGTARAVVLNSGGANACTGPEGFQNTHTTAELVAQGLEIGAGEVLVCSTGLIGEQLPMDVMRRGVPDVVAALERQYDAFERAEESGASLLAPDEPLPTGEQLGEQFEQFLAGLDGDDPGRGSGDVPGDETDGGR